ncbi:hypothetical protein HYC85_014281 [Camellia sinensis]|uniref:Uncharacterized protein n=1 Tax=Camellia sinensis TaxID=4442 RepID=A0A7J7H8Z9_CAMSI|nr:hypothetical protein HYC85_014281 [Camellia sinensis]
MLKNLGVTELGHMHPKHTHTHNNNNNNNNNSSSYVAYITLPKHTKHHPLIKKHLISSKLGTCAIDHQKTQVSQ